VVAELTRQQRVLGVLAERGIQTWDTLIKLAAINAEGLGMTINQLMNLRQIWSAQRKIGGEDVRVYGIERRKGLIPRSGAEPLKRAGDLTVAIL
jgi:hypothetical protein